MTCRPPDRAVLPDQCHHRHFTKSEASASCSYQSLGNRTSRTRSPHNSMSSTAIDLISSSGDDAHAKCHQPYQSQNVLMQHHYRNFAFQRDVYSRPHNCNDYSSFPMPFLMPVDDSMRAFCIVQLHAFSTLSLFTLTLLSNSACTTTPSLPRYSKSFDPRSCPSAPYRA